MHQTNAVLRDFFYRLITNFVFIEFVAIQVYIFPVHRKHFILQTHLYWYFVTYGCNIEGLVVVFYKGAHICFPSR